MQAVVVPNVSLSWGLGAPKCVILLTPLRVLRQFLCFASCDRPNLFYRFRCLAGFRQLLMCSVVPMVAVRESVDGDGVCVPTAVQSGTTGMGAALMALVALL